MAYYRCANIESCDFANSGRMFSEADLPTVCPGCGKSFFVREEPSRSAGRVWCAFDLDGQCGHVVGVVREPPGDALRSQVCHGLIGHGNAVAGRGEGLGELAVGSLAKGCKAAKGEEQGQE